MSDPTNKSGLHSGAVRLLVVEDSEDDTELILHILRKEFEVSYTRVEDEQGLRSALSSQTWDVVVTDHNMPQLNSFTSLALVRQTDFDVPVIILSGSIGEELAVKAMQQGAQDYVLKDKMSRLVPAIKRELKEAKNRRAQRAAEEAIRHLAFHDPLTGLPNRNMFTRILEETIQSHQAEGQTHALLYLDLDQFRLINDVCGHVAGDEYLLTVTEHMKSALDEGDVISKMGGDAFAILLRNKGLEAAEELANEIRSSIKDIVHVCHNQVFRISASIGVVLIAGQKVSSAELISAADVACYTAKDNGRDQVVVSSSSKADAYKHREEMVWTARIRDALENNKFVMAAQRIVSLDSTRTDCWEYLLRLRGDNGELILPAQFLPAAERYNLIAQIDKWVVDQVLKHLSKVEDPRTSIRFVNISSSSLMDDEFCEFVYDRVASSKALPFRLCFEITENAAIRRFEQVMAFINETKSLGCKFALDDFGSGMCSLAYLRTLPADFIKIDISFIARILDSPIDYSIVAAIQRISQLANMVTVAEGVERQDVFDRLRSMSIDYAQGYLIGRPEPIHQ
ncbi:MAG: EAL domain-containing protein [Anaerolineales bacterium]|nr:EAL domain-containing protein [Anaerolineales bacterium]